MDFLFKPLADALGASVDQIKLIVCLLLSYPLGNIFARIPPSRPELKHIFNLAVAFFYLIPMLNLWTGLLQLLFSVLGTYYLSANIKNSYMPWIVFVFTMGHLTINHVIRAVYNYSYETVEITGPQMVLTMKLTTFAWNVYDGRRAVEDLDKWQLEKRVTQHPSLLSFLGYAFYFPGLLVGPYLEFANYQALVDGTTFKTGTSDDTGDVGSKRLIPKGRKRVAYRKMITGLVFLYAFVTYSGRFNYGVALQPWYAEQPSWYRIGFFQIAGIFERTKYYAIWTLTEGAAIVSGLGFSGFTPSGGTLWEGAANVQIMNIELAPNHKVLLDAWNMKTNVWLRECVYKRVTPKGKKPGFRSSMITFLTSAFWHGIAGGYYLAFVFAGFVQTVARLCRSHIRPLFLPTTYVATRGAPPPPQTLPKRMYDLVGTICCVLLLNYQAAPFMLLTVRDSLLGWSRLGWYGHIMVGSALLFFYGGGIKILKGVQKARLRQAGVKIVEAPVAVPTAGIATPQPAAFPVPPLDEAAKTIEKVASE